MEGKITISLADYSILQSRSDTLDRILTEATKIHYNQKLFNPEKVDAKIEFFQNLLTGRL